MKEVFYSENRENSFEITEKEFKEAMVEWSKKMPYFCERMGAVLSPYWKYITTPPPFEGRVFVWPKRPYLRVVEMVDGTYSSYHERRDGSYYYQLFNYDKAISELVDYEDFVDNPQKYLPKPSLPKSTN